MSRAAAETALLNRELNNLSGSAVRSSRNTDAVAKSTKSIGDQVEKTGKQTREAGKDIDRYSGRLRLLTEAAVTLGPALIPIGAAAVPALAALTAGFGAAAGAAGVAVLAFHGVGDGLKALDAYQLEPTQANLEKMRAELDSLGPAGAAFVTYLDSIEPQLKTLQTAARAGLFPGVEQGITSLLGLLPQVRAIISNVATEMGNLAAEAGGALAGPGFSSFFNYLETDAAPTLEAFAHTLGNVAQGFGSLMVAFAPLSRDFSSGMESMSRSFADWAAGLSQTDGFRGFVAYVRETGPQVVELLGAMGTAFVGILRAAAPVGSAVLPALTALAKVLGTIANSPIGAPLYTAAAAMLVVSRGATLASGAMTKFSASTAAGARNLSLLSAGANFAVILAGIWAVDKAMDKVFGDGSIDTDNLSRNLTALADGRTVDNLDKIGVSVKNVTSGVNEFNDKVFGFLPGDTTFGEAKDNIDKIDQALAQMVESGNADQAAAVMAQIVGQSKEQGISAAETTKQFGQYKLALDNTVGAAHGAADAMSSVGLADRQAARDARQTRTQVMGLVNAMMEQRSAALGAFDAVTQYGAALAAARKQAKSSDKGLNEMTAAGRRNRDALSQLAAAWNNQSAAVRNNVGKFREARGAFIQTATAMGVPISKARELASRLLAIPKSVVTKVEANTNPAIAAINAVNYAIAQLHDKTVTIHTVQMTSFLSKRGGQPVPGGSADGSTVPKTGLPYADRHLYLLADGEEVISNRRGQADRFRPLLKAINNAADGATVGLAGGGTARGGGPASILDFETAGKSLRALKHGLDEAKNALEKETAQRKSLISSRNELRSGISSGLRTDIFAQNSNPWAASSGGPFGTLKSDISRGKHFADLIQELKSKGVDGAALVEIIGSGDVQRAEMMANLTRGSLRRYERLYNQRERVLSSAGGVGGQAVYGAEIRAQTREVRQLRQEVHRIEGAIRAKTKHDHKSRQDAAKTTADGVNGAAQRGHSRGGK